MTGAWARSIMTARLPAFGGGANQLEPVASERGGAEAAIVAAAASVSAAAANVTAAAFGADPASATPKSAGGADSSASSPKLARPRSGRSATHNTAASIVPSISTPA